MTGWSHRGWGSMIHEHHARPGAGKSSGDDKGSDKPSAGRGPHGFGPPAADSLFQHRDENKDGKLTKDEVPEAVWTRLSVADTDKDGSITKSELETHLKAFDHHKSAPGGHAFGGGPGVGRFGSGRPGFGGRHFVGHPSADRLLEHADKNKDGKLTKDELPEPAWNRLSAADADKDGSISKSELEAMMKKRADHSADKTDKKAADKPKDEAGEKGSDKPAAKVEEKPAEEKPAAEKSAEEKPEAEKTE